MNAIYESDNGMESNTTCKKICEVIKHSKRGFLEYNLHSKTCRN